MWVCYYYILLNFTVTHFPRAAIMLNRVMTFNFYSYPDKRTKIPAKHSGICSINVVDQPAVILDWFVGQ